MQPLSPAGHPPGAVNKRHPFSGAATTAGMGEQRERMADIARASAGGSRSGASGAPDKRETNQSQDRQARAAVQAGTPTADMAGPAGLGCSCQHAGKNDARSQTGALGRQATLQSWRIWRAHEIGVA